VVGVDNAALMSMMLANSYNCIAVGTSTGAHPQGGSSMDLIGRMKPDIVGTATWTSYATPIVASSATLMIGEINRSPALAAARHPLAIKSILMAGATKTEFPGWQNSPTRPLDNIYGAGEVNIYNSYKILVGGRQAASSSNSVAASGWDVNATSSARRLYFINVPSGKLLNLSAVLTWYRHIASTTWTVLTPTLQNLDLVLWKADSSLKLGAEVYRSASALDNVEHIYSTSLTAGVYALEVIAPVDNETYALAWRGELKDDPNAPQPPPAPPGFANLYSSLDIGSVGVAGYTNYNAGADEFTISGAGADIAAFKDAFHFAYAAGNGDLELITRIQSFSAGDAAAKAGLMIRDSLSANAAHASIFSTAASTITFARRPVNGGSTTSTTVSNVSLPLLVKLRRTGNVVTAYYSSDGSVWASLGAAEVNIRSSAQVGLAVTSRNTGTLATARFTQTALNTGISSATLNGLTLYQVGSSKVSASATVEQTGVLSVTGTGYILPGGSNREGSAFLAARGNGDGAIYTQLLAARAGTLPLRAGLMIRESLLDNAMYVALTRTNSNYVSFEYRTANGGYATTRLFSDAGRYLLLDRRGNTFTALVSSDGSSWRTLGTVTIYLRSNPHQGVFVISSNQTSAVTADFEQPVTAP
jgi:regulation of enolase protein 1 (concanavalin A-like superfamily)